jgi:hypothetical protein
MAEQPLRPRFKDGQPLAATDLALTVDHARNRAARHERMAHTLGIVAGLDLATEELPMAGVTTLQITVKAGLAVDGAGRQIVLANDQPLPPDQFLSDVVSPEFDNAFPDGRTTFPYPLLLTADEHDGPAPAFSADGCGGTSGVAPVVEDYQLRIGRRGEHLQLAAQESLGPGEALDGAVRPFRLLLGFVRFHMGLQRYVAVLRELDDVRPRRGGVRAGEVVSGGEQLLFRVGDPAAAGQPALVLESANGGGLRFGSSAADGSVTDVFSISAGGIVTIPGKIDVKLIVGAARMVSGVATDGMHLPLPSGVTEADITAGDIQIHAWVSPVYPPTAQTAFAVGRCDVDERRVVRCQLYALTRPGAAVEMSPVPVASCHFVVAAVVPPQGKQPGATP